MHPSGKSEPPLPFPNGAIRLIEPHCLNNVAKYRKASPISRSQSAGSRAQSLGSLLWPEQGPAKYGTFRYLGEKHSGMQKLAGSGSLSARRQDEKGNPYKQCGPKRKPLVRIRELDDLTAVIYFLSCNTSSIRP